MVKNPIYKVTHANKLECSAAVQLKICTKMRSDGLNNYC